MLFLIHTDTKLRAHGETFAKLRGCHFTKFGNPFFDSCKVKKEIYFSPSLPTRFWDLPSLLFSGYRGLFPQG